MKREEATRVFDFIYYQNAHYPQEKAFGFADQGEDQWWSTAQTGSFQSGIYVVRLVINGHQTHVAKLAVHP